MDQMVDGRWEMEDVFRKAALEAKAKTIPASKSTIRHLPSAIYGREAVT
jgi:hypothetical protein